MNLLNGSCPILVLITCRLEKRTINRSMSFIQSHLMIQQDDPRWPSHRSRGVYCCESIFITIVGLRLIGDLACGYKSYPITRHPSVHAISRHVQKGHFHTCINHRPEINQHAIYIFFHFCIYYLFSIFGCCRQCVLVLLVVFVCLLLFCPLKKKRKKTGLCLCDWQCRILYLIEYIFFRFAMNNPRIFYR